MTNVRASDEVVKVFWLARPGRGAERRRRVARPA